MLLVVYCTAMNNQTEVPRSKKKLSFEDSQTLTNYIEDDTHQTYNDKQPKISIIRRQILDIKNRRRPTFSIPRSKDLSLLIQSTTLTTHAQRVTVMNQSQEDKIGLMFSPFKDKIKPIQLNLDTSIDWERRGTKGNRQQQENAIMKKTLEVRRASLVEGLKNALSSGSKSFRSNSKSLSTRNKPLHASKLILPQNVFLMRLQRLKQLYSVLADIMVSVARGRTAVIKASQKYINSISSLNLEFIDDFVDESEQRLQKAVRQSRILESTSVMYLMLELLKPEQEFNRQAVNLTNLVGYSASNLILLTRMFILAFKQKEFHESQFQACITRYETLEFKQQILTMEDAVTRMCHNNEIIQILNGKLGRVNRNFSNILKQYMKKLNRKKEHSASQHTHYLFQFLAFHLHSNKLTNIIPFLDCAPNPYLASTSKPYTIIIQPYGVLLLMKNSKIRARPFTDMFLQYLCINFSVIFWTWMMPQQIDQMFPTLPDVPVETILYKYHCVHQNGVYSKNLNRIGRDLQKTLVIDYSKKIFEATPGNGIECGWNGSMQDQKLLQLAEIIKQMQSNYLNVEQATRVYNQEINTLRMVRFRSKKTNRKY